MRLFFMLILALSSAVAQQATTPTARISGGVMAGQLLTKVQPVYPQAAKDAHISGFVVMHAIVGSDGLVKDLTVVSGPALLRDAAMDAVKQWTYKPYLLNGRPTDVDTTITVNFTLTDTGQGAETRDTGQAQPVLPPLPTGRVRVSSGVMAGQKLSGGMPNFCLIAGQERVNGTVSLHVVVDRTGSVSEADVTSGAAVLRQAATEAVRGWMFKPYLLNGDPVEVETTVTISESCGS
jgi:TonB family protein